MPHLLFYCIFDAVKDHNHLVTQHIDSIGRLGLSTLHKVTTAFHILWNADALDEYLKIDECITIKSVKRFC